MKIKGEGKVFWFILIIVAFLFIGFNQKYYTIPKSTVNYMIDSLEDSNIGYSLDDYFCANDILLEYFSGESISKEEAKLAFELSNEYVDNLLFGVDEVTGVLINLE